MSKQIITAPPPSDAFSIGKLEYVGVNSLDPNIKNYQIAINVLDKYSPVHKYQFYFGGMPDKGGCNQIKDNGLTNSAAKNGMATVTVAASNSDIDCFKPGGTYTVQAASFDANDNQTGKGGVFTFTIPTA